MFNLFPCVLEYDDFVHDRLSIIYVGRINLQLQHYIIDHIFLPIFNRSMRLMSLSMTHTYLINFFNVSFSSCLQSLLQFNHPCNFHDSDTLSTVFNLTVNSFMV